MRPILHIIARALFRAGGLGLLTLGAFDSSPLVVPMGNDLLVLALSARYPWFGGLQMLAAIVLFLRFKRAKPRIE